MVQNILKAGFKHLNCICFHYSWTIVEKAIETGTGKLEIIKYKMVLVKTINAKSSSIKLVMNYLNSKLK